MSVTYDDIEAGAAIPPKSYQVTRLDLVKYCGASGDFNVIHWNERIANSVGLPGVIAHGMYTMAQGGRFISDWAGDPGAVVEYGVRFSALVPVPDDTDFAPGSPGGATVDFSGVVKEKLDDNKVAVDIVARCGDAKVLSRARAVVRLP